MKIKSSLEWQPFPAYLPLAIIPAAEISKKTRRYFPASELPAFFQRLKFFSKKEESIKMVSSLEWHLVKLLYRLQQKQ